MKVVIVGGGHAARAHARAWTGFAQADVAGIVSRGEGGKTLAAELGCLWSSDLAKIIDRTDVVDICTPTPDHAQYAVAAARAGKHVICETPLAGSLADARTIIEECVGAGVRLLVGHVLRFRPEYARARQLVHEGEIGTPGVCRLVHVGAVPGGPASWRGDDARAGGCLLDWGILDFDWMRWTFGEVARIHAAARRGEAGGHRTDYAIATLRHESGCISHVEVSWAHPHARHAIDVSGRDGKIEFDSAWDGRPLSREGAGAGLAIESPTDKSSYRREIEHFSACIRDDAPPIVTPQDAYEALRIALAARESAASGAPIALKGDRRWGA